MTFAVYVRRLSIKVTCDVYGHLFPAMHDGIASLEASFAHHDDQLRDATVFD